MKFSNVLPWILGMVALFLLCIAAYNPVFNFSSETLGIPGDLGYGVLIGLVLIAFVLVIRKINK